MKIVITYGTFDLLHWGHIKLLERAKKLGDYLIVGITTEEFDKARGKLNVVQSLEERKKGVESLGLADLIIEESYIGQKIDDIKKYKADIFTVGSDWVGEFDYLGEYCTVVYIPRTAGISSSQIRNKNFKIGYICGCFDLFHVGHLNILEKCKENCDYLIVGICADEYIQSAKHRSPVYPQEDRARLIKSLKCVNDTIIVSSDEILDKLKVWKRIKFDILFNGSDWLNTERSIRAEKDLGKVGVEIKYFPYTTGITTSDLIKKIKIDN